MSTFRSLVTMILPLIGIKDANYCDGPYDGGKDFNIVKNIGQGIEIGIQISVEKNWQKKIMNDAAKLKSKYNANVMYFISSRRIPEGSFEQIRERIMSEQGVAVTKYDNQAIAGRLINNGEVNNALLQLGIDTKTESPTGSNYLSAKNEAVSSLLLFNKDSQDLRERFFESILKSHLSRLEFCKRNTLIEEIKNHYNFDNNQAIKLKSSIDRLLQKSEIVSKGGILRLSPEEQKLYSGLRQTTELGLRTLESEFSQKVKSLSLNIDKDTEDLLLRNFLDLTIHLSSNEYSIYEKSTENNIAYKSIKEIISSKFGHDNSQDIFSSLSEFFAQNEFTKHIACSKLYEAFLNTNSSHLINALGGTESLNVYIDSSVFIPIICGLLYESVEDRYSKSGASLYKLISDHKFNAIIPSDYIEEVASHLIEACRDYKHIVETDIDLSHSGNAFVSHYSTIRQSGRAISFEDYVKVFGIRLNQISENMEDKLFWKIRDRASSEISKISAKYGFTTEQYHVEYLESKINHFQDFLYSHNINRAAILVRHDAKVIAYLSGDQVPSGFVKVLCTWDKAHSMLNPEGLDGYFVMHPVAIIDYLSLASGNSNSTGISHLLDFASLQADKDLELSAKIWDAIAKIEKDNLSDAEMMTKAKNFQEHYLKKYANDEDAMEQLDERTATEWMSWRA
ncbi:hypothetical protein HNR48_004150 [Pseudoteredinibacter isoporae]|uniref:Uncharacterized protein n=1 Tax=Pseudoteredinibacter isoporae TaxID=570281 RepID=A0A7X0JX29_9GAMM|nr:hypothetical protein [Pseudoteredinibacter isoporae]